MSETKTHLGPGGRIVIPARWRRLLGIGPGDEVILLLEEDGLRLLTPSQAVRRAQRLVRAHVRKGRRLSQELIAERRAEVRRG